MEPLLEEKPAVEYIAGRPYRKVSPKRTHAIVQLALGIILKRCAGNRGSVGPEWRFKLFPDTELVPDMAFVSYARLRGLSARNLEEPPFAPDVAAEIRSPSDRPSLAAQKLELYLANGAQVVLDVDPRERFVEAHVPGSRPVRFRSGDCFAVEALPWLRFDVDELFADLDLPR